MMEKLYRKIGDMEEVCTSLLYFFLISLLNPFESSTKQTRLRIEPKYYL